MASSDRTIARVDIYRLRSENKRIHHVLSKLIYMPARKFQARRMIRAVILDGEDRMLTVDTLMEMPRKQWETLRNRLTDRRRGKANEVTARCVMCGHPVYIASRKLRFRSLPLFQHFRGGNPVCPWYQGETHTPDAVRAAQYRGHQESEAHRRMCELVLSLAQRDPRHRRGEVNQYLPPTASSHGRYPDVYLEWDGMVPFAIELQLSNTFQTEISGRYLHYQREGIRLLWVLVAFETRAEHLPQSFRDVVNRHRGNAFVLDEHAAEASRAEGTLILSCFLLRDDESFDPPKLVRLDELTFPETGLAYFEDRIALPILKRLEAKRQVWRFILEEINCEWTHERLQAPMVQRAIGTAARLLRSSLRTDITEAASLLKLIAALFSIMNDAAGAPANLLSHQPNTKAMLNSFLINRSDNLAHCASIIEYFLARSAVSGLLSGTVGEHIRRAKDSLGGELAGPKSWQWAACERLFPEIFDAQIRDHLRYWGALPTWATPLKDCSVP